MLYIRKFFPLVLLPVLFAGCSSITNLTPQQQTRNATGLYPVEVALASRQQTLRWETIKPSVVVGVDFYPMRPTSLMKNRWETLVPVPATTNVVYYKFKFDFQYNSMGHRGQDSKLSGEYKLTILDK
jgi:hypothetical protein